MGMYIFTYCMAALGITLVLADYYIGYKRDKTNAEEQQELYKKLSEHHGLNFLKVTFLECTHKGHSPRVQHEGRRGVLVDHDGNAISSSYALKLAESWIEKYGNRNTKPQKVDLAYSREYHREYKEAE